MQQSDKIRICLVEARQYIRQAEGELTKAKKVIEGVWEIIEEKNALYLKNYEEGTTDEGA